MATPAVLNKVRDDSGMRHMDNSQLESTRKYVRGQPVKVTFGNGELRNGHIADFGVQDLLPLYWVKIDGVPREVLKFEFELDVEATARCSDGSGGKRR